MEIVHNVMIRHIQLELIIQTTISRILHRKRAREWVNFYLTINRFLYFLLIR